MQYVSFPNRQAYVKSSSCCFNATGYAVNATGYAATSMAFTQMMDQRQLKSCLSPQGGGLPIKSDGGVRMLRVPNFLKNYTAGCANLQKIILLGALFL